MTTEHVDARPALASALVTAIDHVGIAVADLDAAIKWYHDHLGMIVLHEEVNEDQGVREAMLSVRGAPVGSAQRARADEHALHEIRLGEAGRIVPFHAAPHEIVTIMVALAPPD